MQRPGPQPRPAPYLPTVASDPSMSLPAAALSVASCSRPAAPQPTTAQIPSGRLSLVIHLQQRWVQERPRRSWVSRLQEPCPKQQG
uniref:Uncharacterized protein n=1 Tax=Arundo donax TaxID=35708 RepID=A0A0A9GB95_ARUDO